MVAKIDFDVEEFKRDSATMTLQALAKKYKARECTVSVWRRKYNLVKHKKIMLPDRKEFEEEIRLYPNTELARRYGVGLRLISKWRVKLGLANVWQKGCVVDWNIFDRDATEMRWWDACEKYGVSRSAFKLWKMNRGLTCGKTVERIVTWREDGKGCWICTSHEVDGAGYPQCKKYRMVAKKMWIEKNGAWPEGMTVLHECDNKLCVNPDHIKPGEVFENGKEMAARDRSPWGERQGHHKLTAEQAREIFSLKDFKGAYVVAERFHVAPQAIYSIWAGRTWKRDIAGMENFPVKLTEVLAGKKLTWTEVQSIRSMQGKCKLDEAARMFKISSVMVWKIWNNKSWVLHGG